MILNNVQINNKGIQGIFIAGGKRKTAVNISPTEITGNALL